MCMPGSGTVRLGVEVDSRRRGQKKLDIQLVKLIRLEWQQTPRPSSDELARRYQVSISTIEAVVKRKTWKDVPV